MSNIGMERHEVPNFQFGYDDLENPTFFWQNPYSGKREIVARLYWPEHPVEATSAVEWLFENLELRVKSDAIAKEPFQPYACTCHTDGPVRCGVHDESDL